MIIQLESTKPLMYRLLQEDGKRPWTTAHLEYHNIQ